MKNRCLFIICGCILIVFIVIVRLLNIDEPPVTKNQNFLDNKTNPSVVVKIYYEVLCPDSRNFMVRQLYPSFQELQKANLTHLVTYKLIPYGKASTRNLGNGKYQFNCQHGEPECILNRLHACAISQNLPFSKTLEMIKCSIANPKETTDSCGMQECSNGDLLLREHGIETNMLSPSISFVPTVTINDSQRDQAELLRNFHNVLLERIL